MDSVLIHNSLVKTLVHDVEDLGGHTYPSFNVDNIQLQGLFENLPGDSEFQVQPMRRIREGRIETEKNYSRAIESLNSFYNGRGTEDDQTVANTLETQDTTFTDKMDSMEARVNWSKYTGNVIDEDKPVDAHDLYRAHDPDEEPLVIQLSQNSGSLWRKNKASRQHLISMDNLLKNDDDSNPRIAEFLHHIPVFHKVSVTDLAVKESEFTIKAAAEGDIVLQRGEVAEHLYIIRRGFVSAGLQPTEVEGGGDFVEAKRLAAFECFGVDMHVSGETGPTASTRDYMVTSDAALLIVIPFDTVKALTMHQEHHETSFGDLAKTQSPEHAALTAYMDAFKESLENLQLTVRRSLDQTSTALKHQSQKDLILETLPDMDLDVAPKVDRRKKRNSLLSPHVMKDVTDNASNANSPLLHERRKAALALDLVASHRPELNVIDTVQHILRLIQDFFDVERVGFFLVDKSSEPWKLELLVSQDDSGTSIPLAGIAGHVVKKNEVVNVADCYKDARFDPSMDIKTGYKTVQLLALPILSHDNSVRGVLQLVNSHDQLPFDDDTIDLVQLVTNHLEDMMVNMRSLTTIIKRKGSENSKARHRTTVSMREPHVVNIRNVALASDPAVVAKKEKYWLQVHMNIFHGNTIYGSTAKTNVFECNDSTRQGLYEFNEQVNVDEITISRLPLNTKLVFTVVETNEKGVKVGRSLGWGAVNLFTSEQVLKTGLQRFNLQMGECKDALLEVGRHANDNRLGEMMIELPKFDRIIVHQVPKRPSTRKAQSGAPDPDSYWSMLTDEEYARLEMFLLDPLHEVTQDADRALLWKMRYGLMTNGDYLPIWLQSINWFMPDVVAEAYNMLYVWQGVTHVQALQLLGGSFGDAKVRSFAVQHLDELDDDELVTYLLPLARNLRYEPFQDSSLARFLLRRAAVSPDIIGVPLLWHLVGESPEGALTIPTQAAKIALTRTLGNRRNVIHHQANFIQAIEEILDGLHPSDSHEERDLQLKTKLSALEIPDHVFLVPYNPYFLSDTLTVDECHLHRHIDGEVGLDLVVAAADDPNDMYEAEPLRATFTMGTDHRRAQVVLQCVEVIKNIFHENDMPLSIHLIDRKCIFTGDFVTFTESPWGCPLQHVVDPNGLLAEEATSRTALQRQETLRNMQDDNILEQYLSALNKPENMMEVRQRFLYSMAAWNVIIYVLGLRNGDTDNVYIDESGIIMHTSFDMFLKGHRAVSGGVSARGKQPFLFPRFFLRVLGGMGSPLLDRYVSVATGAFMKVRENIGLILANLAMFSNTGIPELMSHKDLVAIRDNLMPNLGEEAAKTAFQGMLTASWAALIRPSDKVVAPSVPTVEEKKPQGEEQLPQEQGVQQESQDEEEADKQYVQEEEADQASEVRSDWSFNAPAQKPSQDFDQPPPLHAPPKLHAHQD